LGTAFFDELLFSTDAEIVSAPVLLEDDGLGFRTRHLKDWAAGRLAFLGGEINDWGAVGMRIVKAATASIEISNRIQSSESEMGNEEWRSGRR
jgi:hypothetical protein